MTSLRRHPQYRPHVVVLGAGLLGVSSAYYLAQRGLSVTVIEPHDAPARATSYANAGLVSPGLASLEHHSPKQALGHWKRVLSSSSSKGNTTGQRMHYDLDTLSFSARYLLSSLLSGTGARYDRAQVEYVRLAQESNRLTHELLEAHGLQIGQREGQLVVYRREEERRVLAERLEDFQRLGLDVPMEFLTAEEVLQEEQWLQHYDGLGGGVRFPSHLTGDSRAFAEQLVGEARKMDVKFRFGAACVGFEQHDANEPEHITHVRLESGERLAADQVLLCAGPYTSAVARMLPSWRGFVASSSLPVAPLKGHSITVANLGSLVNRATAMQDSYLCVTPLRDGALRMTFGADFVGLQDKPDADRIRHLTGEARKFFPGLTPSVHAMQQSAWAGLRPLTPDGLPLIGHVPGFKNVWVNAGHGLMGWTLAAASGKLLADNLAAEVLGTPIVDPVDVDPTAFDPVRFLWPWHRLALKLVG